MPDKMMVPLLQAVDHSHIQYEAVQKCFYKEHTDVKKIPVDLIDQWMKQENIQVSMPYGMEYLKPVWDFSLFGLNPTLSVAIKQAGYDNPTPIQSTALPVILSGYDLIAVAKTGSGKTYAFVWPMLEHIIPQKPLDDKEGPIGVILAPTRELAEQIYKCVKPFSEIFNITCKCIVGGLSKWEQKKSLFHQPEIVVGTPGRLIDMIKMKATNMIRCTYIVLDEADRMFELGFEPQIRSIIGQIQPSRQTIMCSATFHKRVEILARDILTNPVRVVIGNIGQSNDDINQEVYILKDDNAKWGWLLSNIMKFIELGKVLLFTNTKENTERISENLNNHLGTNSEAIHGDKIQYERNGIINRFKKGITNILIATDVAARGLDIQNVKVVINYDKPKNIETYVHRIGRTGRIGKDGLVESGTAYTLLTQNDSTFAADLVYNLEKSNQRISKELIGLANRNPKFRATWKPNSNRGNMLYKPTTNTTTLTTVDNNNNNNNISSSSSTLKSSLPSTVQYHKTIEQRMDDFADLSGPVYVRNQFASTFVKSFEVLQQDDGVKSVTIPPKEQPIKSCTILPPKEQIITQNPLETVKTTIKDNNNSDRIKSRDRSNSNHRSNSHNHSHHHHSPSTTSSSRSRSRSRSKHHNHHHRSSHSKHH